MVTRRQTLTGAAALAGTLATPATARPAKPSPFVQRKGTGFVLNDKPYRYVGTNMWYAAWLGAPADYGNRDRLRRELDALKALGVTNIRANASAEESPLNHSVKPTFHGKDSSNADLLVGLDFFLAEMAQRDMKAVLYLTNFWEWSGGMQTYLYYVTGKYMDMNDPAHPWPAFPNATAQFYANPEAMGLFRDWVKTIVGRTNSITGKLYADDPTIMAWQHANEPRPAGDAATAEPLLPAYYSWIRETAKLIKTLDRNHLVCTGNEGLKGTVERADVYKTIHGFPEVDYCTAHIWPLNWSWVDAKDIAGTNAASFAKVHDYLDRHLAMAKEIGKPLVIEEFGYPRDGGGYDTDSATLYKDGYYKLIYDAVEASARSGGPLQGSNFWAWNGEGRAVHGDHKYKTGDNAWLGDPPHEPQGWYGVFDSDATTKAVIAAHAKALAATF
ncbi:cellulase family glycosylhydrolase [Sphingomonas sp. LB-2]|uniref:glycoside hydrolase 5 family protein n=1 Tax=Sphingomonas caeni TaxID=2984949 RepID=UPI00222F3B1F|nr:cellulase family glycosylhydrolase [Sphingomonas caeni]MCW3849323.1 cellulase family glycosylhydrolase [Sphingomonas caeni]